MERHNNLIFNKKFFLALCFSWLIFIAIDFVSHTTLLKNLWIDEEHNLKPKEELFKYIPEGYLSFLFFKLLVRKTEYLLKKIAVHLYGSRYFHSIRMNLVLIE